MKFPKLIGDLSQGMSVGEGKAKALDNVNAPFLTAVGPGFITRKKGGFTEVVAEAPVAPPAKVGDLWLIADDTSQPSTADRAVVQLTAVRAKKAVRLARPSVAGQWLESTTGQHVNPERIGAYYQVGVDVQDYDLHVYEAAQHRIDLASRTSMQSLPSSATAGYMRSIFGLGWDSSISAYRWGYATKAPSATPLRLLNGTTYDHLGGDGFISTSAGVNESQFFSAPVMHAGNVGGAMSSTTPSHEGAERCYFGGHIHVTGPGQATGLVVVADYLTDADAALGVTTAANRKAPYFLHTADFGRTWSRIDASFVVPFLRIGTGGFYTFESMLELTLGSAFIYVGGGKSLFVMRGRLTSPTLSYTHKVYLFEGGAFTPLSWPYDNSSPNILAHALERSFGRWADSYSQLSGIRYCFGPGCCAVPATPRVAFTGSEQLWVTRDYGASWSTVSLPANTGPEFMVLKPYLSTEVPGTILMMAVDLAGDSVCMRTDGNFTTFTSLGTVPRVASTQAVRRGLWAPKSRPLYPQLPGEFAPP